MVHITDNEKRKRIIKGAMELFYKFNFTRVTSDEIAAHLGISKKTIYNYFGSKKEILSEGIDLLKLEMNLELDAILSDKTLHFTEKLKLNLTTIAIHLNKITPNFGEDLRKNVPDVWDDISNYKKEAALLRFRKLLESGKKSGYVNKQVDMNMALLVYMSAIDNILDPLFLKSLPNDVFSKIPYATKDLFNLLVNVIFLGVLSEKAKNEYLKN